MIVTLDKETENRINKILEEDKVQDCVGYDSPEELVRSEIRGALEHLESDLGITNV